MAFKCVRTVPIAASDCPCIDIFGSNATPMGGSAGRADALVGAVEAQKAEGVLHLHMFLYIQNACQFNNLSDLADMIRKKMIDVEAYKEYISYVRCAEYPDPVRFWKKGASLRRPGLLIVRTKASRDYRLFSGMHAKMTANLLHGKRSTKTGYRRHLHISITMYTPWSMRRRVSVVYFRRVVRKRRRKITLYARLAFL